MRRKKFDINVLEIFIARLITKYMYTAYLSCNFHLIASSENETKFGLNSATEI